MNDMCKNIIKKLARDHLDIVKPQVEVWTATLAVSAVDAGLGLLLILFYRRILPEKKERVSTVKPITPEAMQLFREETGTETHLIDSERGCNSVAEY
jgi:hypothetical protein